MGGYILIADDEPHVIRVLRLALERDGYQVESAPNGQLAFEKIMERRPDVLITDIAMPRMTGRELCEKIEAEMPDREFLIFVSTSRTELEHREWSRKIRNLMFIEKPASTRRILDMLNDYNETRIAADEVPGG
ncbi:MAG: response regulator [Gammaproteobacteria bacterium]|nr:response regulator [Gammaproteobacteria bacterium]